MIRVPRDCDADCNADSDAVLLLHFLCLLKDVRIQSSALQNEKTLFEKKCEWNCEMLFFFCV